MRYAVLAHATDNRADKVDVEDGVGIYQMEGHREGQKPHAPQSSHCCMCGLCLVDRPSKGVVFFRKRWGKLPGCVIISESPLGEVRTVDTLMSVSLGRWITMFDNMCSRYALHQLNVGANWPCYVTS